MAFLGPGVSFDVRPRSPGRYFVTMMAAVRGKLVLGKQRVPIAWIALSVLAGCGGSGGGDSAGDGGGGGPGGGEGTYSTNFDRDESPISEGGAWVHQGLAWTFVDTEDGIAFGTQSGTNELDDSYAYLTGFPPDVRVDAVVHIDPDIDPTCTHEVEIHLRWSDGPNHARGYECLVSLLGSAQIFRWNGPLADYTLIATSVNGVPGGRLHGGDTVSASVVGDRITLFVNDVELVQVRDSTWSDGNPGMGFFLRANSGCDPRGVLGFTRYTASSIP
jgi:hypothetical protein